MEEEKYKQDKPFYPIQGFHMDSWKRAVQHVINDVVTDVLAYDEEERTPRYLLDVFKEKWQALSPFWFNHQTSYYLWLVHISGTLLPFLEKERGSIFGWVQYREYPKVWSSQHFTVPLIKENDCLTIYVFEKNDEVLFHAAEAMAINAQYSREKVPKYLQLHSVESGRTVFYHLKHAG
ncbi:hypothetical protein SAMN05192534_11617 [Alteribacillus persepolensis]|uniref:Uncharacterized protein n=1 Tax=Alteribacillus persepolensis TaxID=568899 RepID=A0A1G8GJX9_9BACI|nr:hypothetical protein [Alteribacillus persepolensis]SDH94708.1 hypothetical protein SAMN05192534_11617 [Alteribacillus persepolensis]